MSNDVAIVSLSVLDHADQVADKDDSAAKVQVVHVLSPAQVRVYRSTSRQLVDADVEETGHDDEEAKDDNLNNESGNDNVLSKIE